MSSRNESGFTLIEVAVAAVIGVILIIAIGLLGGNVIHQRVDSDSNSAAANLAQRVLEEFIALPTATPSLCGQNANPNGTTTGVAPPYHIACTETANVPVTGMKKVIVTVTHNNNPRVATTLRSYIRVS